MIYIIISYFIGMAALAFVVGYTDKENDGVSGILLLLWPAIVLIATIQFAMHGIYLYGHKKGIGSEKND